MRALAFIIPFAALAVACDYAPAEKVRELSRDVGSVKSEQRVMRAELDATKDNQNVLQTSVRAIGSGFNVLTESVSDQETRVDHLETRTSKMREQIQHFASGRRGLPQPVEPNLIGMYVGARLDTKSLDETPVRLQWCESEEGTQGFLTTTGQEPDFTALRCWRFGDVAIFRNETAKGPKVQCLRGINVDEAGTLRAIDCESGTQLYKLTLR